jgi:hypothetical protein
MLTINGVDIETPQNPFSNIIEYVKEDSLAVIG